MTLGLILTKNNKETTKIMSPDSPDIKDTSTRLSVNFLMLMLCGLGGRVAKASR